MTEYRLIFQWDSTHWTAIAGGSVADIIQYIDNSLAEMQDGLNSDEDAQFYITKYTNGDCSGEWYGSPEDLLGFMQEEA